MTQPQITVWPPSGDRADRIAVAVDRLVGWLARHWLALFNTAAAVFVGLPFVAPLLMAVGLTGPAQVIYLVYRPTCHQLPERSFFLFGAQGAYSVAELEATGALPSGLNLLQREFLRWVGDPEVGYKVAICERDVAIYSSILLGGLIYGLARAYFSARTRRTPRLPVKGYLILLIPMLVDGATQLVGLRESTWPLRIVTGGLFGLATVWLAYPYVEDAMQDVLRPRSVGPPEITERAPCQETR
jgi:uncharacterized membrane protein